MIELFEHNRIAYEIAVEMLETAGKAAIIHPTGTGKSFIGFKLCEDNPKAKICWLSPSEYIFKTQIENLQAVSNGYKPDNCFFYTYARLMNMSTAEKKVVNPDFIILDEFHRCGAEMWGQGIKELLELYPTVPVLGLSATHIRYLDEQRDMANELFDGNIASYMTLGEAIARGILKEPKYVIASYSLNKELIRLANRVRDIKNVYIRNRANLYLEAARRSLENADGLDVIFEKHIENRKGKYLLFASNFATVRKLKSKCQEWFSGIDALPHIYTAYSDDPLTSKAFSDFKNDKSEHIKILISINMLNEGIHVDDISGVILFRTTVSPIIFKQQIGRALCANKAERPIILDIVANIYNLYSINAINDEITEFIQKNHENGDGIKIVVNSFSVIDEVQDCRKLFSRLDDILTSSWNEMFACLETYYKQNGNSNVLTNYKTEDGVMLGNWCSHQRQVYRGKARGILNQDQINKLDSVNFRWDINADSWKRGFSYAKVYYEDNGDLLVPATYVTTDGFTLGHWIRKNRADYSNGKISEDRITALSNIGMAWTLKESLWQTNFQLCKNYYLENGKQIPTNFVANDGSKPGSWLARVITSTNKRLSENLPVDEDHLQQLNDLGLNLENYSDRQWMQSFEEVKKYFIQNGNLELPSNYTPENGTNLYKWLIYQRNSYNGRMKSKLSSKRIDLLNSINFNWVIKEKGPHEWTDYFNSCKDYMNSHDGKRPPLKYIDSNSLKIGYWLTNQFRKDREKKLPQEPKSLLESIGVDFSDKLQKRWKQGYDHSVAYFKEFDNLSVPAQYKTEDGYPLGEWVRFQVKQHRLGKLNKEREILLEKINIIW